jgi:hypothetical protein
MTTQAKIDQALQIAGLPALTSPEQARKLGEGAWHNAFLLDLADGRQMVLRFPKDVSYNKPFTYDEKNLRSEYGGAQLYYAYANRVQPGICPEGFFYHVTEDLTFTVESYAGRSLQLAELDQAEAREVGRQLGSFFRAADEVPVEVEGFGFLEWDGEKIRGSAPGDMHENLREELPEYGEELQTLVGTDLEFDRASVQRRFAEVQANRRTDPERKVLTNRDLSPENLLWSDGRLRMIDPVPLAYSNLVFAGHFVHLYRDLYPHYHSAPRYARHQFHLYREQLNGIAEGFVEAYSGGDGLRRKQILGEGFLFLITLTLGHYNLLQQEELSDETCIRAGSREAIAERLPLLLRQLETYKL